MNDLGFYIHGAHYTKDERIKGASIDSQIEFELETLFKRLDVDKDGVLSEEELFKAMNASSHNKYTVADIKEVMRMLDNDGNGKLDKDEFLEFMLGQVKLDIISAEDEMEDLRAKFKQYDLDGNGWLSPAEV